MSKAQRDSVPSQSSEKASESTLPREIGVLIVDDVPANVNMLRDILKPHGYTILVANSGKTALRIATEATPDLILLDIVMPEMDGYEVCRQLKQKADTQQIPVIFITGLKDQKSDVIKGFRVGGVDYITKPIEEEEVLLRVKTHLEINRLAKTLAEKNRELEQSVAELAKTNQRLQIELERHEQTKKARRQAEDALQVVSQQEAERWGIKGFVGSNQTVRAILEDVHRLADVKTSVLICGESGTGKELIARAIHFGGTRGRTGPFVPINCSAIPAELAESTLFGHVRGAFTGATADHRGAFELSDGGTLFLDEIGDMPLELQTKLLRVLEEETVTPVGGTTPKRIDVRILAATNAELQARIAEGMFREDLYYRLAHFTVEVPPLRERREDIPLLSVHFLEMFAVEMRRQKPVLSPSALSALRTYHFPGNIRELKNIIESALIKSDESEIRPEHLRFLDASSVSPFLPSATLPKNYEELKHALTQAQREAAKPLVHETLTQWVLSTDGNIAEAARRYQIDRAWLHQLAKEYDLDLSGLRGPGVSSD